MNKNKLIIVTGMSGAGLSTLANILEDMGYETVENLPLYLFDDFIFPKDKRITSQKSSAIIIDYRSRAFDPNILFKNIQSLKRSIEVQLIFVDSSPEVLAKRFHILRRSHPYSNKFIGIEESIAQEKQNLFLIREKANLIFDTTHLSTQEFGQIARNQLRFLNKPNKTILPMVISFAYRHGIPLNADTVFDVRFFTNPYYNQNLRPLTGLDVRIAQFIMNDGTYSGFFQIVKQFITLTYPKLQQEGRTYFTLAFGCTGGQHRSVFWATQAAEIFENIQVTPLVYHRELKHEI